GGSISWRGGRAACVPCKPRWIERGLEVGRLAGHCRPQRLRFGQLLPGGEASCIEERGDQTAQSRRARIGQPAFPALDGAQVDACPSRKGGLAQGRASAVLQRQGSEAVFSLLGRSVARAVEHPTAV